MAAPHPGPRRAASSPVRAQRGGEWRAAAGSCGAAVTERTSPGSGAWCDTALMRLVKTHNYNEQLDTERNIY